jgi:DNA modification methylase
MTSYHNGRVTVWAGDCRDVLAGFEPDSFDSACIDPPYHFASIVKRFGADGAAPAKSNGATGVYKRASTGFMSCKWDGGQIAHEPETWAAVLRVLKPGAHLVAFHAPKNWHRLALAIEDAGFEIRDTCLDLYSLSDAAQRFITSLSLSQCDMLGRLIDGCDSLGALFWNFGSGFPKSHNPKTGASCSCSDAEAMRSVRAPLDAKKPCTTGAEQSLLNEVLGSPNLTEESGEAESSSRSLRDMREADRSSAESQETNGRAESLLQPVLLGKEQGGSFSQNSASGFPQSNKRKLSQVGNARCEESGVEGRGNLSEASRELCFSEIRTLSGGPNQYGTQGRLCDGTPTSDGALGRQAASKEGNGSSLRPLATQQSAQQSGTLAGQSEPQTSGAWPICERCGKPIIPNGLGSALKPAYEPIILARKPLARGKTIAGNVMEYGTGALNIDACRVSTDGESFHAPQSDPANRQGVVGIAIQATGNAERNHAQQRASIERTQTLGRWPANLITDGSPEVVAGFPDSDSGQPKESTGSRQRQSGFHMTDGNGGHGDSGSAARFFYTAKADAEDRIGSRHPTVKPLDLIQWLCRLITPPKGHILDCFAGTGTTAEAALREGFQCTLIEREPEYLADIDRRMALALEGSTGRSVAMAKLKPEGEPLPLFAEADE